MRHWGREAFRLVLVAALGVGLPADAMAAGGGMNAANTAWILTSTALVLFMTLPGLALFYGGLVRAKNVLSVLMHCFAIACLVSVLWLPAATAWPSVTAAPGSATAVSARSSCRASAREIAGRRRSRKPSSSCSR